MSTRLTKRDQILLSNWREIRYIVILRKLPKRKKNFFFQDFSRFLGNGPYFSSTAAPKLVQFFAACSSQTADRSNNKFFDDNIIIYYY